MLVLSLHSLGNLYFMYSKKPLITGCSMILYTTKKKMLQIKLCPKMVSYHLNFYFVLIERSLTYLDFILCHFCAYKRGK